MCRVGHRQDANFMGTRAHSPSQPASGGVVLIMLRACDAMVEERRARQVVSSRSDGHANTARIELKRPVPSRHGAIVDRAFGAAHALPHRIFRAGPIDVPSEQIQSVGDAVVLRVDARQLVHATKQGDTTKRGEARR